MNGPSFTRTRSAFVYVGAPNEYRLARWLAGFVLRLLQKLRLTSGLTDKAARINQTSSSESSRNAACLASW